MSKVVVLDLEFCRINKENRKRFQNLEHEIIEIGAIMLDENMNVIGQYQQYIKPQYASVSKEVTRLTGITNEMLVDKQYFEVCIKQFMDWIGSDYRDVEIHSWSLTDLYQMQAEVLEKQINCIAINTLFEQWHDVQRDFCDGICYDGVVSLSTAMSAIEVDFAGKAHSALADADNTAKLVALMADQYLFEMQTNVIRSLFEDKEEEGNTLGELFADIFGNKTVCA